MLIAVSRVRGLNLGQRIVLVIALAGALYFVGLFVTSLETSGWVAYAPLSRVANAPFSGDNLSGLHPWVRLVVWLGLTVIWATCSVMLLRSSSSAE
jgi:hypothetical protein